MLSNDFMKYNAKNVNSVLSFAILLMMSCVLFFLTSCASHQKSMVDAREKMACKTSCKHHFTACQRICDNSCPTCCLYGDERTNRSFAYYVQQQRIQGLGTIRNLDSYQDPLQCRKTTCDCPTDYQVCLQTCTKKIPKRLQMAPHC